MAGTGMLALLIVICGGVVVVGTAVAVIYFVMRDREK